MEPVTYLVGLSGLMGGYMWFLYHNREASYRSAMNFTISKRQSTLYEQKGFNLQRWESLVEEGNRLRREIQMVADEYDVEWHEERDEGDEKVAEALRKERRKARNGGGKKSKDDDDDD
jgi:calcium uniporter protein, mitochondrial